VHCILVPDQIRIAGVPIAIWVALIVASTVFVKQHYVADVIGGLLLAFGASLLFLKYVGSRQ
ncbi:MAG TPA: phosphatase PAP2 family protein, partial [Anaerolineae bacterium]